MKTLRATLRLGAGLAALSLNLAPVRAASASGPTLPPADPVYNGHLGRTVAQSSPPAATPQVVAPKGAPNVLIIMTDDTGFGSGSTFGGPVPMPTLDALAKGGLIYNDFHTAALCSPTRAALLTGRNHHSVGFGVLAELSTGYPGYNGLLPRSAATIGEVLRENGYSTAWIGKNHNTPPQDITPAGPFERWPNGLGFDEFYGFMGGETNPWAPILYHNHTPVAPPVNDPGYILDRDLADHAITWLRTQHSVDPDKPFLLYYAPGTSHSPLGAPKEWIDRFRGRFDQGWDKVREETFNRQKAAGVIPASAELTPRPPEIPAWDSLSPDQKRLAARMMEVYAGALAYCDAQVGRVIESLRESGQLDNTIVIFIEGDNGSSGEGGLYGTTNDVMTQNGVSPGVAAMMADIDKLGGPMTLTQYPAPWAWAMDTPFQWTKQIASHFGGTRNGLVVSWPSHIKPDGKVRNQFTSVIDIAPTLYQVIGIKPPSVVNGVRQQKLEGFSFASSFANPSAPSLHTTQYFEIFGNRAIYKDGWMASTHPLRLPWIPGASPKPDDFHWELYDVSHDYSQAHDLAATMPAKLDALKRDFYVEAAKYKVLPIDSRGFERLKDMNIYRTNPRLHFTYYPGEEWYDGGAWPDIKNRSWSVTASVDLSPGAADGFIVGQGGRFAGWSLFMLKGKPVFVYRRSRQAGDVLRLEGVDPLSPGAHKIRLVFDYDGGGVGKGGQASLFVDDAKVADGHVPATVPAWIAEPGKIGHDVGTPVAEDYALPFNFQGRIERVDFDLKPAAPLSADGKSVMREAAEARE
jgi:arylsulfatase A-like enzyme